MAIAETDVERWLEGYAGDLVWDSVTWGLDLLFLDSTKALVDDYPEIGPKLGVNSLFPIGWDAIDVTHPGLYRYLALHHLYYVGVTDDDDDSQFAQRLLTDVITETEDASSDRLTPVARRVHATLRDVVDRGVYEIYIHDNWPYLRTTGGWRAVLPFGLDAEQRRERLRELENCDYRAYLSSPEWKQRRATHISWARNRCQVCNGAPAPGNPLEVHHRTYERRGRELACDLIVLCGNCHSLFHSRQQDK